MAFRSMAELVSALPEFLSSPRDEGIVAALSVRPDQGRRKVLESCEVSAALGAHGDRWSQGSWVETEEGQPHQDVQLSLTNSRCMDFIAQGNDRWSLPGDNLFVDFNLTEENLRVGQRLKIGSAMIDISPHPHTPCDKFEDRFGRDARVFVAVSKFRHHRLRGVYARIIEDGVISVGDVIRKIAN